jgi:hypothetical protein
VRELVNIVKRSFNTFYFMYDEWFFLFYDHIFFCVVYKGYLGWVWVRVWKI